MLLVVMQELWPHLIPCPLSSSGPKLCRSGHKISFWPGKHALFSFWWFTGAWRGLAMSIWAIRAMPCYGFPGQSLAVAQSGHRIESSLGTASQGAVTGQPEPCLGWWRATSAWHGDGTRGCDVFISSSRTCLVPAAGGAQSKVLRVGSQRRGPLPSLL